MTKYNKPVKPGISEIGLLVTVEGPARLEADTQEARYSCLQRTKQKDEPVAESKHIKRLCARKCETNHQGAGGGCDRLCDGTGL